jgi:AcrR family transcriptional regulator
MAMASTFLGRGRRETEGRFRPEIWDDLSVHDGSRPLDRSERRQERTRKALLAAGRELIAEHGVAGLRVLHITERADIAHGSFYTYFDDKDALVEAIVSDTFREIAETVLVGGPPDEDPAAAVSAAVRNIVGLAFQNSGFARLVVNLSYSGKLLADVAAGAAVAAVARGVEVGRFDVSDQQVEVTITVTAAGCLALLDGILEGRHEPGVASTYAEAVLRSLGIEASEARAISRLPLP